MKKLHLSPDLTVEITEDRLIKLHWEHDFGEKIGIWKETILLTSGQLEEIKTFHDAFLRKYLSKS